ncbi:MAG: bifunctional riboflavin kinase/FAD synthetase [Lachnospiraceae bacterium]|nr:bifunctional riboflavin kinase/FAD synthetase [Lachnospiraceae bacterium]
MQIIQDTINFHIDEPTVVTIGKFDGIHKGHEEIFNRMLKYREKGLKLVVFTFDMPVTAVLKGVKGKVLTTRVEKRRIFKALGADYLIEFPFNEKTASISADEFIDDFLVESLNMKAIVMGSDCRFGHRGTGTPDMLVRYAHNYGYEVEVVDYLTDEGEKISSSKIRKLIERGDLKKANELLMRPYFFYGEVVHGNEIGRKLSIPTINLVPKESKLIVPNGVYFSTVNIDGVKYRSITNIGVKPTVEGEDSKEVIIESHIYDFNKDIYGKELTVSILDFLRPEMTFSSLDALKDQLKRDVQEGEIWHKKHPF